MVSSREINEAGKTACIVCGPFYDANDLAAFGDDCVCVGCRDGYVQCLKEGVPLRTSNVCGGAYRNGKRLIAPRKGDLILESCCYCAQPAAAKIAVQVLAKKV